MIDYEQLLKEVRDLGMDHKWANMFIKKMIDDESFFNVSKEEALWAIKRGFYPGRIKLYGLTEENYKYYLQDFNYFMLHPLNNHFKIWLDKTTLKYVLNSNGCEDVMPRYFFYVENDGSFTYLMDMPSNINRDKDVLLNLLKEEKILAMKPNSGTSGGFGFIKLELKGNKLYENNKEIDLCRFEEIRDTMRNYIVTEYVHQHMDLAKIWPKSECTLRVIMVKNPKESLYSIPTWSCAVSYARFGTSINGGASNLSSGGVGVGFDFKSGKYNDIAIRYKKYCPDGRYFITEHPDTGFEWSGKYLPNWDLVRNKIDAICRHISSLDYLGLDIIITANGMKLCEINTHPAMDYEQIMCGPMLAKEEIKKFFEAKGLYAFDSSTFLKSYQKAMML